MSKAAKDGNNFRREWDLEAFEKRAKDRLDAELVAEEEREHKKTAPQPIVQRAPLQRRTEDLQIAKFVGTRTVVSGQDALTAGAAGVYYCKVCECHLRDSANYLAHINGRKHNRMLGMSMRAERSTLGEVRARLEAHKQDEFAGPELSKEEKAQQFLEHFDERLRQREEEAKIEAAEKRRAKKLGGGLGGADDGDDEAGAVAQTTTTSAGAGASAGPELVAEETDDAFAAMMGFGGFGGSRKTN